jgi:hypothetical protein
MEDACRPAAKRLAVPRASFTAGPKNCCPCNPRQTRSPPQADAAVQRPVKTEANSQPVAAEAPAISPQAVPLTFVGCEGE